VLELWCLINEGDDLTELFMAFDFHGKNIWDPMGLA
jgi:hypothetical protein